MRRISLSICVAFAFFVASAVAQTAPGGSQGTQGSSPSMSQPGQQPGYGGQAGAGQSTSDQNTTGQNQNNGEKKLKGCVQSQGGQYVLETKHGKQVALTGQDVSAHVGHEVAVKGTWESGGGMSATASNSGSASGEKSFSVTNVKMISESCGGKGSSSDHSGMGNSGSTGNSGSPSGTGPTTSPNSGTQQPPQ